MPRQRLNTTIALLALGSCCVLAPAASASSTLLSGYGGPGQGNQAILGSTLIGGGGSSGGGGGGGSASAGSSAPQSLSIEAAPAPHATQRPSGAAPRRHATHQRAGARSTPVRPTARPKTVAIRPVSAPALGLSGTDIAYVVLGFLVLMLTAVVTVLLTRGERPALGGRGAKDSR